LIIKNYLLEITEKLPSPNYPPLMAKKLNNSELRALGFAEPAVIKEAGKLGKKLVQTRAMEKADLLAAYRQLLARPADFAEHPQWGKVAQLVLQHQAPLAQQAQTVTEFALRPVPLPYPVFGAEGIERAAIEQMEVALRLPVAEAGALMPDAHVGYGLPIGGVLATSHHAVIPYAVGVDIACRMCLSVFAVAADQLKARPAQFKRWLVENTVFGLDQGFAKPLDHEVFEQPEWGATPLLRRLRAKAVAQVGTSGTGNHFVEWGQLDLTQPPAELGLPPGEYLALLSHSGSRGLGAAVAKHYSKLAMQLTRLPRSAQHLAWLDLGTQEGQEYWLSMNLAGQYAAANHQQIHYRLAKALGEKPALMVENHHNFAWQATLPGGTPVIVHRKGATPAGPGDLGIIPGSMTQPGFLVRGKGHAAGLHSASHGAGRQLSRAAAKQSLTRSALQQALADKGVHLLGGDLDEAPQAYKNIHQVMAHQTELVEVLAKFSPKIVRMAEPDKRGRRED
jgi:tRNA-splicing ligase RtcB (3'-phosphate/5'-hydroxy nucleic acid ligase)